MCVEGGAANHGRNPEQSAVELTRWSGSSTMRGRGRGPGDPGEGPRQGPQASITPTTARAEPEGRAHGISCDPDSLRGGGSKGGQLSWQLDPAGAPTKKQNKQNKQNIKPAAWICSKPKTPQPGPPTGLAPTISVTPPPPAGSAAGKVLAGWTNLPPGFGSHPASADPWPGWLVGVRGVGFPATSSEPCLDLPFPGS